MGIPPTIRQSKKGRGEVRARRGVSEAGAVPRERRGDLGLEDATAARGRVEAATHVHRRGGFGFGFGFGGGCRAQSPLGGSLLLLVAASFFSQ